MKDTRFERAFISYLLMATKLYMNDKRRDGTVFTYNNLVDRGYSYVASYNMSRNAHLHFKEPYFKVRGDIYIYYEMMDYLVRLVKSNNLDFMDIISYYESVRQGH